MKSTTKSSIRRGVAAVGAVVALFVFTRTSQGQITGVVSSDVEGFFGATSDLVQQSEPPIGPGWGAVGFALPYGPLGNPNMPALYSGYPTQPELPPVAPNIPFASVGGHAPSSPFSGGSTTADYHIYGGYFGTGAYTRNAYAVLGNNTGSLMYLSQATTATGYAYEEEEFAVDYTVGANGLMAGAPGPRPYLVYGSFLPGGSAEFGADVTYWWIPITGFNINTGVYTFGAPYTLGSLQYDDYLPSVTGPFVSLVPDTGYPNYLNGVAPGSNGFLEITGDMFLEGDPVDINVEAVPEPASAALLALGMFGVGLAAVRRRSRLCSARGGEI